MSEMNFDYYKFRIKNGIEKVKEETTFYGNNNYSRVHPINHYLVYLLGRLTSDKPLPMQMTHYDKSGNKFEIKKMNMDDYAKDMDILMYKKPWNKLREIHRVSKIKEFIDELKYGKHVSSTNINKNREIIKNKIFAGMKNKKFGKNKSEVIYDSEKMKITSISCLEFNKKTGLYEIEWD